MDKVSLRVCLVAPVPPPYGGIASWTMAVREYALSRSDVQFHIVDTATRWRAVHDWTTWKRVVGGGLQLIRDIARILAALRSRPDALHLTTSGQLGIIRDLAIMTISRHFRVPVVYHIRFGRVPQIAIESSGEWRMASRAMRMAQTVIAIDSATAAAIRRYLPEVWVVQIPNCIDPGALPKPSESAHAFRTVLFLGWVVKSKGIEELLNAWAKLQIAGWKLVVVGPCDPGYQQELLSRYQLKGVEFLGEKPHSEALRLMAEADVIVLPSHSEGFPNVLLEAMVLGKPIVATCVGAIPEMLRGDGGMLVEPRDVSGLRNALMEVLGDTELRKRMGEKARELAIQTFTVERVFTQYMAVWRLAVRQTLGVKHVQ